MAEIERLKSLSYEVIEMWESQLRKTMQDLLEIEKSISNSPLHAYPFLKPRGVLYGDRIGNCMTYYEIENDENIKYLDMCSHYP